MPGYAQSTEVSSDRSRAELEKTLVRYGADQFIYGWDQKSAIVGFRMRKRQIKFRLPLPDRNSDEFRYTPAKGLARTESAQQQAYEQAVRQRWRALALVVKAKLEAVEAEIASFEDEFLAATQLPDGQTVSEYIQPQVAEAYRSGRMPEMLPGLVAPSQIKALPSVRAAESGR